MSPTFNESSVLLDIELGDVLNRHNRIAFSFYPALPHLYHVGKGSCFKTPDFSMNHKDGHLLFRPRIAQNSFSKRIAKAKLGLVEAL